MNDVFYFVIANDKLLARHAGTYALLSYQELAQLQLHEKIRKDVGNIGNVAYVVVDVVEDEIDDFQWLGLRNFLGVIPEEDFQWAGRALQILRWHYDHQFCGRCGSPTEDHSRDLAKHCPHCSLDFYPRLSPCIITLVTRGDECLLAWHSRTKTPRYSCLAGFIEAGESPEQTLVREVMEEVGIVVDNARYVASQPWPFPGQLMLGYFADYVEGDINIDPQEIASADWFRYDQLPEIPPVATISRRLIDEFVQQRTLFHMNNN